MLETIECEATYCISIVLSTVISSDDIPSPPFWRSLAAVISTARLRWRSLIHQQPYASTLEDWRRLPEEIVVESTNIAWYDISSNLKMVH